MEEPYTVMNCHGGHLPICDLASTYFRHPRSAEYSTEKKMPLGSHTQATFHLLRPGAATVSY